ncbi:type II toxin-antitoxin system RelE/ParE family toxin [Oceaniferula marina]
MAPDCRRLSPQHLKRSPYSLVYRIEGESLLLVVAVAHSSRQPNYWEKK